MANETKDLVPMDTDNEGLSIAVVAGIGLLLVAAGTAIGHLVTKVVYRKKLKKQVQEEIMKYVKDNGFRVTPEGDMEMDLDHDRWHPDDAQQVKPAAKKPATKEKKPSTNE